MERSKLTLEDRNTINGKLDHIGMHLSEFSFPNLYLFREIHRYEILHCQHGFFLSGLSYDNRPFIMPMLNPEKTA